MTARPRTRGGRAWMLLGIGLLVSLGSASCTKSKPTAGCVANDDCDAGAVCISSECRTLCKDDVDCEKPCSAGLTDGQLCTDNLCVVGCRDTSPAILSIDGNSPVTAASGHQVHNGLVIHGEHLEGTRVLISGNGRAATLLAATSTSSRIDACLPNDTITPGAYTLTVTNQAGSSCGDFSVLQGEAGQPATPVQVLNMMQTVDGSGSGLDADSLDGLHAQAFLPATGGTIIGGLSVTSGLNVTGVVDVTGSVEVTGGLDVSGRLQAQGDLLAYGRTLTDVINLRPLFNKAAANAVCTAGTAIHVPWSYRGRTGNDICAADSRGLVSCKAVVFVYVTNANGSGVYAPNDRTCADPVDNAWPWGSTPSTPDSLDSEWSHGDTHVVCCGAV